MESSWILYVFPVIAVCYTTFFFGFAGVAADYGNLMRGWVLWLLGLLVTYAFIAVQIYEGEPYVKIVVRYGNFLQLATNVVAFAIIVGIGYVSLEALCKGVPNGRKR